MVTGDVPLADLAYVDLPFLSGLDASGIPLLFFTIATRLALCFHEVVEFELLLSCFQYVLHLVSLLQVTIGGRFGVDDGAGLCWSRCGKSIRL